MAKYHVSTTINGDPVEFLCEPDQTLLDVLRDELNLTGSKEGCASGDCGACSVTVDGRLVCSCLVLGAEVEGKDVETIEGMADGEDPASRCSRSFWSMPPCNVASARQVFWWRRRRYSTRIPDPSETEVRYWLAGNLCRCTGYDKIIRAVMDTAADMRGKLSMATALEVRSTPAMAR